MPSDDDSDNGRPRLEDWSMDPKVFKANLERRARLRLSRKHSTKPKEDTVIPSDSNNSPSLVTNTIETINNDEAIT